MSHASPGARAWQDHLQLIWDLETTDGINYSALAAIHSRARRRQPRPTSQPQGTTGQQ